MIIQWPIEARIVQIVLDSLIFLSVYIYYWLIFHWFIIVNVLLYRAVMRYTYWEISTNSILFDFFILQGIYNAR